MSCFQSNFTEKFDSADNFKFYSAANLRFFVEINFCFNCCYNCGLFNSLSSLCLHQLERCAWLIEQRNIFRLLDSSDDSKRS